MSQSVAIIPARGGSQRIPGKNIRPFNGLPMIAWSIRAARDSGCFDSIIVSTDSDDIARVAESYGAEVPFRRPAELSDAHTGTGPVVVHGIRWLLDQGQSPSWVCCIYATAPFLTGAELKIGLEALRGAPEKRFAFGVTSFAFPIQRAIRRLADGGVEPFYPEYIPCRSQDLEPAWHDAGQFSWGRPDAFLGGEALFAPHSIAIPLPRHQVLDIDTHEDWEHAELLHQVWLQRGQKVIGEESSTP